MINIRLLRDQLSFSMIATVFDLCQTRSLSLTARRLGKSKSHVSTLLKQLESLTELQLLHRQGKQVYLNEQGLSLGKSLYALINLSCFAEQFPKLQGVNKKPSTIGYIKVTIPIRFFGGGMSQTLIRTVAICRRLYPNIFIACEFFDEYNYYHYNQTSWSPQWQEFGSVQIHYSTEADVKHANDGHSWLIVQSPSVQKKSIHSLDDLAGYDVVIPKMPWELMQQMAQFLEARNVSFSYQNVDYVLLLAEKLPENKLLLINSLLLTQSLRESHDVQAFPESLTAGFTLTSRGRHPVVEAFQSIFMKMLSKQTAYFPRWKNRHTLKQWEYFYQVMLHGSFSAASKALFISQPAMSKQIKNMEVELGRALIQRCVGTSNMMTTDMGKIYLDIAEGMHLAIVDIVRQVATQHTYQRQDLNLGILPSVDKSSHLLDLVMNKISRWREQFPELSITIVEERHHSLLNLLHHQEISLAITEDNSANLLQYPISQPEVLGLVIHSQFFDGEVPRELSWESAAQYPLVLLRQGTGIRSIIDQHCIKHGISLTIALESDSLNLNQRWVKKGSYATILPQSAMGTVIEKGSVLFIPLTPYASRILKISHLKSRRLTFFEKSLLDSLRHDMGNEKG